MKLNKICLLCCLILSATPVMAQQISLQECIDQGLHNNYEIRIMRNQETIAAHNATRGNAGQLPTVDLSGSYTTTDYTAHYNYSDGTQSESTSFNQSLNTGLNASWSLFEGFSLQANYRKLQELKTQGELSMRETLENFVADVTSEYYLLIRQHIRLSNLAQTVALSRERLRIVQESFQIGSSSGLDYQQAMVDFNADTSDYIAQVELVRTGEINLNELMALDDIERHTLPADTAIVPNATLDKDALWENTLKQNTSLLQTISQRNISDWDVKSAKSRNYPYLRLTAGYSYRNYQYSLSTSTDYNQLGPTIGASAGIVLYDSGNRRREQRNAQLTRLNQQLRVEQMENSLHATFAALWMAYQNNLQLWDIEKKNLVVARSNFSIAMERYRLRELSGIELREAQLSLLESEERFSSVEYNIKICEISLLQISGDLLSATM